MKTLECRCVLLWRFKAPFPLQTATMCFSPGTSGVTCVTTDLPGSPDAIQMPHPETHTGLFVCSAWGFGPSFFFFFFFLFAKLHPTHTQTHARLHQFTSGDAHFETNVVFGCTLKCIHSNTHVHTPTLTNHPLSEVNAAVENKRQISYFTSLTLACFCSLLTCLATSEDQELN